MTDKLEIKGDWDALKGRIKQEFANITDQDLLYLEGKSEELIGLLERKTGESRQAIASKLKDYIDTGE